MTTLEKIRAELHATAEMHEDGDYYLRDKWVDEILDKYAEQEPCDDAISRQAVKEQMIKYGFHAPDMTVTEFVEDLPPVRPQEPKTGHWIETEYHRWKCSVCREKGMSEWDNIHDVRTNFCPNCGARMEVDE